MNKLYKIFIVLTLVFLSGCFSQGRKRLLTSTGSDPSIYEGLQITLLSSGTIATLCDSLITEDCFEIVDCSSASSYTPGVDTSGNNYCLVYVPSSSSSECSSDSDCGAEEVCVSGYCIDNGGGNTGNNTGNENENICSPACPEGETCQNGACVSICSEGYTWDYINDICVSSAAPIPTTLINFNSDLEGEFKKLIDLDPILQYGNTTINDLTTSQLRNLKIFRSFAFFAQNFYYSVGSESYPYNAHPNGSSTFSPTGPYRAYFAFNENNQTEYDTAFLPHPRSSCQSGNYDSVFYNINLNLLINSNGIIQGDFEEASLDISIKFPTNQAYLDLAPERTYHFSAAVYNQITSDSFSIIFSGPCASEVLVIGSIQKVGSFYKIVIENLSFKKRLANFNVEECFFPYQYDYNYSTTSHIPWSDTNVSYPDNFVLDYNDMYVNKSGNYINLIDQTIGISNRTMYQDGYTEGVSGDLNLDAVLTTEGNVTR